MLYHLSYDTIVSDCKYRQKTFSGKFFLQKLHFSFTPRGKWLNSLDMSVRRYIKVILPLQLEWEPLYWYDPEGTGRTLKTGDRIKVDFAGKEYVSVVSDPDAAEDAAGIGTGRIKPVLLADAGLEPVSADEISLWRQVAGYYLCTVGEVFKAAYPASKVAEEEVETRNREKLLQRLKDKEEKIAKARKQETRERYIRERDSILAEIDKGPKERPLSPLVKIGLTEPQNDAYSKIKNILKSKKPALLHGITGSGKTEIYLKLARETMESGKNVLFLVPEIALSRQLEERIEAIFPNELKVFHSGESQVKRREVSTFIRNGRYIVLGTRSSVFLPHRNLGLIVIDEEHDPSYKQDNPAPRYNGRETAIMLARLHGAGVVLGSATPSLESLYNCSVGRYSLVNLRSRYYQAEDADVEIIDTIAERRKNGMKGSFSRKLIEHIQDCLERREQVMILRERRAYSPVVQCEECGNIPKCKRCNVSLSLHVRADGSQKLVCHYCGRVTDFTGTCPDCGGKLVPLGSGTQRIEEEARELFPEARIARLDSDSARNEKAERKIISDFSQGKTDILIGTRMVTKGFDFSGLSLVAVLQADSILGQQDYRADERSLQMLEQFRGRCGRRGAKGLFVIQTSQPDHPVYKSIQGGLDNASAISGFLAERKLFGYPPYSRVVAVTVKDYNLTRLEKMCQDLGSVLEYSDLGKGTTVVGPYRPVVDKIANQHIRVLRILFPKDRNLVRNKSALAGITESFAKERKYTGHITLDVDPS